MMEKTYWNLCFQMFILVLCEGAAANVIPVSQAVAVGETLALACSSSVKVKWTFNNKIIKGNSNLFNTINKTAEQKDEGTYVCFGNRQNGTQFEAKAYVFVGVRMYFQEDYLESWVGAQVVVRCNYTVRPQWIFSNGPLSSRFPHVLNSHVLVIFSVELRDSGTYTCIQPTVGKERSKGKLTKYIASFHLAVFNDYKLSPRRTIAEYGDNLTITCDSHGPVDWWHNLGFLPLNAYVKDNHLYLANIQYENEGFYYCKGLTNEEYAWAGVIPFYGRSKVQLKDTVPNSMYPSYQCAEIGTTVAYMCDVGEVLHWSFSRNELPPNAEITGYMDRRLVLHQVNACNTGKYYCHFQLYGIHVVNSGFLQVQSEGLSCSSESDSSTSAKSKKVNKGIMSAFRKKAKHRQ